MTKHFVSLEELMDDLATSFVRKHSISSAHQKVLAIAVSRKLPHAEFLVLRGRCVYHYQMTPNEDVTLILSAITSEHVNRLGAAKALLARMVSDCVRKKNLPTEKERVREEINLHCLIERAVSSMLNLFDPTTGPVRDCDVDSLLVAVQAESQIRRLMLQGQSL